jgi:phosphatidylinositol glycan class V
MTMPQLADFQQRRPRFYLTVGFLLWKSLLFSISRLSPRPGYDTSTTLLEGVSDSSLLSLVRWDAIYFTEAARRGYIFEQEWAFSWTLTRAMAFLAKCGGPRCMWMQVY